MQLGPVGCGKTSLVSAILGSGDDLSNYFYMLRHQDNWKRRNAFGRVFTGAGGAELGGDPARRYHLCLNASLWETQIASFLHSTLTSAFYSYKWLTDLPEHKMIALPVDIREELIAAACLLPIAVANLRSPLSTVVTCSDATPVRAGVTKAVVSRKCAEALFLHSVHKGLYTRLDWGPDDWSPQVWEGHHLPQVLSEVVSRADWEICGAYDFHTIDHVNI